MSQRNRIAHAVMIGVFAATSIVSVSVAASDSGQQQWIVILQRASTPSPDVASLGGRVMVREQNQMVVSIPAGAAATLRADPAVRYLQLVSLPGDDPSGAPLIGTPAEPVPDGRSMRAAAAALVPHISSYASWDYSYDGSGNITGIGTDTYRYDELQRLVKSTTSGGDETYGYDRYGNMTERKRSGVMQSLSSPDPLTNRMVDSAPEHYTYDEAGNVKTLGAYGFTYDALNQALSKSYTVSGSTVPTEYYIYTPGDERIGVQRGAWWYWSVRDEGGKVLRQYRSSVSTPGAAALWIEDYVWRGGLLLGAVRPPEQGGRRHFHLDHLGSPRLITSDSGQKVSAHDYYPFGLESTSVFQETQGGFDREEPLKFTGHEHDYAGGPGQEDGNGLDYMHARYYTPNGSRFLSVDPVLGDSHRPQSWNRYAYVVNNPLRYTDPDGRQMKPKPCDPEKCPPPPVDTVLRLTPQNIERMAKSNRPLPTIGNGPNAGSPPTKGVVTFTGGVNVSFVAAVGGGNVGVDLMHSNRIGLQHAALAAEGGVHTPSPRGSAGIQATLGIYKGDVSDQRGLFTYTNFTVMQLGVSLAFTKAGGFVGVVGSWGPSVGAGYSTSESNTVLVTVDKVLGGDQ